MTGSRMYGRNDTFCIIGAAGTGISTTTFPIHDDNVRKSGPTTATKMKEGRRVRKILQGQNYLKLRGKY